MIAISCFTIEEARRRLAALPVRDLLVALARYPQGPVRALRNLAHNEITYEVRVGADANAVVIWSKTVPFAEDWRHQPGGPAFREVEHEQDVVAWAMLTLQDHASKLGQPQWTLMAPPLHVTLVEQIRALLLPFTDAQRFEMLHQLDLCLRCGADERKGNASCSCWNDE